MSIRSRRQFGTTVEIRLPQALPPAWFLARIELSPNLVLLILDDDKAIHATWDQLLAPHHDLAIEVVHFTEAARLALWLSNRDSRPFLGLIDHELLRQDMSGLDLIEQANIAAHSILVTSRFAELDVLTRCARLGVRMVPKELVGQVPLVRARAVAAPAVLVIDDDEMILWAWKSAMPRLGMRALHAFASMEQCEAAAPPFGEIDLAFVDLNVPGSAWTAGATILRLKALGVRRVLMATGGWTEPALLPGADGIVVDKVPRSLAPFMERTSSTSFVAGQPAPDRAEE